MKAKFKKYNPKEDPENIDWDGYDPGCEYGENYDNIVRLNKQFIWQDIAECVRRLEEEEKFDGKRKEKEDENALKVALESQDKECEALDSYRKGLEENDELETLTKFVKIKPHITNSKGKQRKYGRIQIIVDESLIGKIAEIKIIIPK